MDTIGRINTSQLDDYVRECDVRFGGPGNPDWLTFVSDFELAIDTKVDITLDPFSDKYFSQQLALHSELSGRELNQERNELVPIDISVNAEGPNPCHSFNIKVMSGHAATIAIALKLSLPPDNAKILDLGVGSGMSSEIMAYCGATVTAVDINPLSIELIRKRAEKHGLPIVGHLSNFDEFCDTPGTYDVAFFFASLHHGLRPWDILRRISELIKPNGKIVLAAEPIQKTWWPHWGLRLDPESAYVTRKYGWFESGWSEIFLRKMFYNFGFSLDIVYIDPPGLIEGSAIAIGAKSETRLPELSLDLPVILRGDKLFFKTAGNGLPYLTRGWSPAEDWGTWSTGSSSGLLLALPPGDSWTVIVESYPLVGGSCLKQDIDIHANEVFVGTISLEAQEGSVTMEKSSEFEFQFSGSQIGVSAAGGTIEIVFKYPFATKPQLIGRGTDSRILAIGIVSLLVSDSLHLPA